MAAHRHRLAAAVATVALAGCASSPGTPTTDPAPAPLASPGGSSTPAACRASGTPPYVLPDPTCTPGVDNPAVTQADIASTICARGWTATVRPPESLTEALKVQQMTAYGDRGPLRDYEEDHLVPLSLGGAPADPHNLWPEPGRSPNAKDDIERAANQAVCSGRISLAAAQAAIARNWVLFGQQLGQ